MKALQKEIEQNVSSNLKEAHPQRPQIQFNIVSVQCRNAQNSTF